jgi:hypothetical protein
MFLRGGCDLLSSRMRSWEAQVLKGKKNESNAELGGAGKKKMCLLAVV